MKQGKVLCVGTSVVDMLVTYVSEEIFRQDATLVEGIGYSTGGDAANEAVILSKLGHKVRLMAAAGCDPMGDFFVRSMEENGVDISSVVRVPCPMTTSIVLIQKNGERNFVYNNGSDGRFLPEYIDYEAVKEADVVSVASMFVTEAMDRIFPLVLACAKEHGAITAGDVMYREGASLEKMKDALQYLDFIFPNYEEAAKLTGKDNLQDIAEVFMDYGVKNVVIKIGKEGCFVCGQGGAFVVPACKGVEVKDTTGAGDNFAAGFIAGILEGKSPREAAAFANAAAAVSIQYVGTTGLKSREEVQKMMKKEA